MACVRKGMRNGQFCDVAIPVVGGEKPWPGAKDMFWLKMDCQTSNSSCGPHQNDHKHVKQTLHSQINQPNHNPAQQGDSKWVHPFVSEFQTTRVQFNH